MRKFGAVILILALAGAAFYFGIYKRIGRSLAESIFPDDTVAYFVVQNVTRARKNFKQTTLGKHFQDPERKAKFDRLIGSAFRSIENAAGFDPAPFLDHFDQQLAAGLFPLPSGRYAGGFVAHLKNADEFGRLLEQKMDPALKRRYPDLIKSTGTVHGISYYKYTSRSMPDHASPSYYIERSHIVFSQSEDGLRRMAGVNKAEFPPLKENEIFQAAKKQNETKGILFFLNAQNALKIVDESIPPGLAGFWPGMVKVTGLKAVRSFSYAVWIENESFEEKAFLDVAPNREGLIKIWMNTPSKTMASLDYFPAGTTNVSATTLPDMAKMWDELNSRTKEILDPQKQQQWEQGQNLLKGLLNFDLRRDLADPVGTEFAAAYEPGPAAEPWKVKFLFAIHLRKPDQFKMTVSRAVALALARGIERTQSNYKGRTVDSLSFAYGNYSFNPSYAYDQSWFVLSSSQDLLKQAIDSKDSKKGIAVSSDFKSATKDFPDEVNGISYTDVGTMIRSYSGMLKLSERSDSAEWMNEYNFSQELTDLARVLEPSGSFTRIEKNGVVIRTHSSIPSGFLAIPPFIRYWMGYR